MSRSFRTECSIRQEDSLSTLLFNIGSEKVMRNTAINPHGKIFNRTRQFIAYADDAGIINKSQGALNEVFTQLQTAAVPTGSVINIDMTKYMKTEETVNVAKKNIELNKTKF
jgi:hypothetical protein